MYTMIKYAEIVSAHSGITTTGQSSSSEQLENRQQQLLSKITALEARMNKLEAANASNQVSRRGGEPVERVERAISSVLSAQLRWVPENYYECTIAQRSKILRCTIPQMLKTVVVENRACDRDDCTQRDNSRYYAVLVQYATRFNAESLARTIRALRPADRRLPRRHFNFQFAPEAASAALTGFPRGAVTPFGLLAPVPVVLSDKAAGEGFLWMGGGHVHAKLGVAAADLRAALDPIVGDVADPRTDDVAGSLD
uniref:YbaK/aminoacyl-tRNA synthetase-associated domain-containing protein n=1 Tax=Heterosigma akashiwo TaxID=2829 RepID=A0A7S3XJ44_HETAK